MTRRKVAAWLPVVLALLSCGQASSSHVSSSSSSDSLSAESSSQQHLSLGSSDSSSSQQFVDSTVDARYDSPALLLPASNSLLNVSSDTHHREPVLLTSIDGNELLLPAESHQPNTTVTQHWHVSADESILEGEEDDEDPNVRRKRQISRASFEAYVNNLNDPNYDPRAEENWWLLYPYGTWMLDNTLMGQPGRETQANLGFDCPYYGFRFNYTFVYPMGMVSFARPPFTQPPWDFPNPMWPQQNDHSFIAPFYADAAFQWVGNIKISNVFFRSVHRIRPTGDGFVPTENYNNNPNNQYSNPNYPYQGNSNTNFNGQPYGGNGYPYNQLPNPSQPNQISPYNQQSLFFDQDTFANTRVKRQMPAARNQVGMVIDEPLLDNITRDVQSGYNGANGWRAEHAFIVTWHRMAYGGAPKAVDVSNFENVKQWQNTFQLVITSDEIRTFAIYNYARLNWTTSMEAGGLNGFGGKQAAMVGFNGGNGTGWFPLPYSGHGRVWKLGYWSNIDVPGRWIHRIDEAIIPGGCNNGSIGSIVTSPPVGAMQGGITVNFTGPCLRPGDFVKVTFENWQVDCKRVDSMKATCIMPRFHKVGLVPIAMSRDGGQSYPFKGIFYVAQPEVAPEMVKLRDDVENPINRWHDPYAETLTMGWSAKNLTYDLNAAIDVSIIGYFEDADRSHMEFIDYIASGLPNSGKYSFTPRTLTHNPRFADAWKKYKFGFIQVSLTNQMSNTLSTDAHGVLWSQPTPFAWYYLAKWQYEYGKNWALDMCIEWFEYDGRRLNFIHDLTHDIPCPCRLEQAKLDQGRFMPFWQCDMDGNQACPFNKGAQHCVQSVHASRVGSQQRCCYDYQGYLMFSDDWEPDGDYLRFFNPGTPARAHEWGSYPYRLPPRIPYLSHYQLDLMPYRTCCDYAGHCEFYYWRRQTNGCQDYRPSVAGIAYGLGHYITPDGTRFTFDGKGYFVLLMSDDPEHKLMIQIRTEQPDKTMWHQDVAATVITGVAIHENNSDTAVILSRKDLRRWRYKTDIFINNHQRWIDKPFWHYQQFNGLSLRTPQRVMNQSDVYVLLASGAGVRVQEAFGALTVTVMLPPSFNATCPPDMGTGQTYNPYTGRKCYSTKGLLGVYDRDPRDDLQTPSGSTVTIAGNGVWSASENEMVYNNFGTKWKVDGTTFQNLFPSKFKPIFNPIAFANPNYTPQFDCDYIPLNATLIFSMEEVTTACGGDKNCQYDYIMTGRRDMAMMTLATQKQFLGAQSTGSEILISCGPLLKKQGIIKTPPAQNYLDGDTVTFTCKPDYVIHGNIERTCINGTWSPGWWAWCRDRNLEYGLKWLTGILVAFFTILFCTCFYCCCWRRRVRLEKEGILPSRGPRALRNQQAMQQQPAPLPPKQDVYKPVPTVEPVEQWNPNGLVIDGAEFAHVGRDLQTFEKRRLDEEPVPTPERMPLGEPPPAFSANDTYDQEPRRIGLPRADNQWEAQDHSNGSSQSRVRTPLSYGQPM